MSRNEEQYLNLARRILETGASKMDRTKTGTHSIFGAQMRFDLSEGFPLLTSKKVAFGRIKSELLWFLRGDNNIRFLLQHHNHIWDEWPFKKWVESNEYKGPDMTDFGLRTQKDPIFAEQYKEQKKIFVDRILNDDEFSKKFGTIGDVYGKLWRHWPNANDDGSVDQITRLINEIKVNPNSRRLILTAWDPETTPFATLPSCHVMSQFYVVDGKISLQMYQRSADYFLGVPFNIASYSLLLSMVAAQTGLEVGEFIHTIGDAHIYNNHVDQIKEQLSKPTHKLPTLKLNPDVKSIFDYEMSDIKLENYIHEDVIKAPIAV
ncbi:thymidylate synthase [Oenococcus oeni]|uniref:thymidylate synthase n=1 Tax=Oenococcus oeni TaxID=1247 RepID=UPI0008F7FEDC|nr:thymidylate synthase [Oenococcus oeni]OIM79075.1 thymidylate synthase [Oenococcus oeni]